MSKNKRRSGGRSAFSDRAIGDIEASQNETTKVLFGDVKAKFGLVAQPNGIVKAGHFNLTATGIDIQDVSDKATKEEWEQLGEMLFQLEGSIQWLIGDWLILGETLFEYGAIADVAEHFKFDADYFYDLKSIALSVPYANRLPGLSHGHHRAVRALENQRRWLIKARQKEWSVAELRRQIKLAQGKALSESSIPLLAKPKFITTFQRIVKSIERQKPIKKQDIEVIEKWLEQVRLLQVED